MKKTKIILSLCLFTFLAVSLFAGSPLAKTSFYNAYLSNEKVQIAYEKGIVTGEIYSFLADDNNAIGLKAAVINALAWNEKGKNNADTYKMYLGRKYGKSYDKLNPDELAGDEVFCLGYMMTMDNNKSIKLAIPYLEKARILNPKSYTVNMIYALAHAEVLAGEKKECEAWKTCDQVRNNTNLKRDMDPAAIDLISTNIDQYKDSCN